MIPFLRCKSTGAQVKFTDVDEITCASKLFGGPSGSRKEYKLEFQRWKLYEKLNNTFGNLVAKG